MRVAVEKRGLVKKSLVKRLRVNLRRARKKLLSLGEDLESEIDFSEKKINTRISSCCYDGEEFVAVQPVKVEKLPLVVLVPESREDEHVLNDNGRDERMREYHETIQQIKIN